MNNYFEGWYFKHCLNNFSCSFIPGISNDFAFIQVITNDNSHYITYSLSDVKISKKPFSVQIGDNYFSKEKIKINIKHHNLKMQGEIFYKNIQELKHSIMGPFEYVPFMECKHGIISTYHELTGKLVINGISYDFNNGVGYIEKDLGTSFPKSYIWVQANSFSIKNTCLFFSYATIPFHFTKFNGFICVFILNGKEYRFATYNFAKINKIDKNLNSVDILLTKGKYKLYISANVLDGHILAAPNLGNMTRNIKECIRGKVSVKFYKSNDLLFDESCDCGSIEVVT